MDLYCLRHPRPDIKPGICYGQKDIPLAADYKMHRRKILADIKTLVNSRKITKIYTSPLSRCLIPATMISESLNIPMRKDPRLMEINFGQWEGHSFDQLWKHNNDYQHWCDHWKTARPPQGEGLNDFIQRVQDFAESNSLDHSLVVSHSGVIRCFHHLINKTDINNFFTITPDYGSLTHFMTK